MGTKQGFPLGLRVVFIIGIYVNTRLIIISGLFDL